MDTENDSTIFSEPSTDKIRRRTLLSWWIKLFCWLFMLGGIGSVLSWLLALIIGERPYVNLFTNQMNATELISVWGGFLGCLILYKMYVGYMLWFEKDNAIALGKADALISILACVVAMGISLFSSDGVFQIRLEIILLIPYYLKLSAIEYQWKYREYKGQ